jgi:hypothetical protein
MGGIGMKDNHSDGIYVFREADEDLYRALQGSEICYILASKQAGKSSLANKVIERLSAKSDGNTSNYTAILISLGSLHGTSKDPEKTFYKHIIKEMEFRTFDGQYQEFIKSEIEEWIEQKFGDKYDLDIYKSFIRDYLLQQFSDKIIIFIDEIDQVDRLRKNTTNHEYIDDFFTFIRSCAERHDEYQRLNFCLLGTIEYNKFVKNKEATPFNRGIVIRLKPFNIKQSKPLVDEIERMLKERGVTQITENICNDIMNQILTQTGGHPFLTVYLCYCVGNLYKSDDSVSVEDCVKNLVDLEIINQANIILQKSNIEVAISLIAERYMSFKIHFTTVENRLLKDDNNEELEESFEMLNEYQNILINKGIIYHGNDLQEKLILSGLVRQENNLLISYNRIYSEIYDLSWVQEKTSSLRSFATEYREWKKQKQKQLYLLTGSKLEEAREFLDARKRKGKRISSDEELFINESKTFDESLNDISSQFNIDPSDLREEINYWTGGIEIFGNFIFNTFKQKKDSLLKPATDSPEENLVENLVRQQLEDLSKLSDRHFGDQANKFIDDLETNVDSFKLISEYKRILEMNDIDFNDESPEHLKLKDMCFILKKNDRLSVLNQIYKLIFDRNWVDVLLARTSPHAKSLLYWQEEENESFLLNQEELQTSINWIKDINKISKLELKFIVTSLVWQEWNSSEYSIKDEVKNLILKFYCERLKLKLDNPLILIGESLKWTIGSPSKLGKLLNWICNSIYTFPNNPEEYSDFLRLVISSNIKKLDVAEIYGYLDLNSISGSFWQRDISTERITLIVEFIKSSISLEEKNQVEEIIKAFDEYPQPSYDRQVSKFDVVVLNFLNNLFLKVRAKYMASKLDELLNSTVEESDVIEAIAIVNLQEGTLEYNNKQFKSKRPDVYQALFGQKDSSEALGEFGGLVGIPKALNTFGEATKYGTLEYSMFYLEKGIIVVYFMDLPGLRAAICFIATTEAQFGSLIRQCRKRISDIKKELDKQFS